MTESSHKKRSCDETGSLCASLFLHGMLFLVLSSNSSFDPPLGPQTRLDILWFTPAVVTPPLQAAAPQAAPAAPAKPRPQAPPRAVPVQPAPSLRGGPHPAATAPHPAALHGTLPERKAVAAKAQAPPTPKPPLSLPRAAAPVVQTAATAEPAPTAVQRKKAEPAKTQLLTEAHLQTQERNPSAQVMEQAKARRLPEPVLKQSGPDQAPQQPSARERGTTFASIQGDLKLTVAGDGVKLSVAFREVPRSRRDRPPTKAEARRLQQVAPVTAKRDERTKEAVIERAGEGVYIFSAEPETASAAQASFTLTIYEAGKREKTASIGTRNLQKKTVVARILMPEGVLWDDDSAFTGSLEDSDSTTKFNAQTGLYWKEYAD